MSHSSQESGESTLLPNGPGSPPLPRSSETPTASESLPSTGRESTGSEISETSPTPGPGRFWPTPRAKENGQNLHFPERGYALSTAVRVLQREQKQTLPSPQLPLYPEDSPVSLSVQPGSEEAETMTAISGRRCFESYMSLHRGGSWLKTFLASLLSNPAWRSRQCLLTWKLKDTKHGRVLCQLRASAPRTSDTEYSLWRSPSAQEPGVSVDRLEGKIGHRFYDKKTGRLAQVGLTQQVKLWATPQASDWKNKTADTWTKNLSNDVRMWPTPNICGNYNRKGASASSGDGLATAVMLPTPTSDRWDGLQSHGKNVVSGQLNADWVELLVGLPRGWTRIGSEESPEP